MNITIINDCRDENAKGRQITRSSAIIGGPVSFVGVANDIEAAGNLIDILDAYEESPGVVLVNVAPRNGKAKKWPNGTPFGYFRYKNVLVVSSIDGLTLSLVKKLKLADEICVLDTPTVIQDFVEAKSLSPHIGEHIINTQFRSYDFLPRIAQYLLNHDNATHQKLSIKEIENPPYSIWWVDNFGNCKTTLLKSDITLSDKVTMLFDSLAYFEHLKDVPDNISALITGSSGIGDKRFLEIVSQGKNSASIFSLKSGDIIIS